MHPYINKLMTHLSQRTPQAGDMSGQELLEQLWYYYIEETTVEPEAIRAAFREIDRSLELLPSKEADRICDLTCRLCYLYQHSAFLDGVTLGAQLSGAIEDRVIGRPQWASLCVE